VFQSRTFRIIAWVVVSAFAVTGLFVVGVHTPPARRFVLRRLVRILGDQGIGFEASRLDYNLFGLRLDLRGVRVLSRQTPDLPPVLLADRVWVDVNLPKLIRGAYYLDDGGIDNPQIQIVVDRDGRDNLPHPPTKSGPPGAPVDYLIRHLRIAGGGVRIEERRQQIAASVPLDSLTVTGDPLTRNHQVHLETRGGGQVSLAARSLPVRGLAGDLVIGKDAVQVTSFRVGVGDSSLTVAGRVNSLDSPRFEIHSEANLALASLVAFAGRPETVRGNLNLALTATGPLAALKATVSLRGENLVVDRFDHVKVDAEAAYDASSSRVRLSSLNLTTPWASVRGQGELALNAAAGSTAKFAAERCDLDRLSAILHLPVRVASTANASVDARWKGLEAQDADVDATVRLSASQSLPAKDTIPVNAIVHATVRGNRIFTDVETLSGFGATASGEVVLQDRKTIGGGLRLDAPRLSSTIAAAEAFLGKPAGSLAGTPLEGTLTSWFTLAGTVAAPAATVKLVVPDLSAGDLQGVAVNAAVGYVPDRLTIDGASVGWNHQTLQASGTIGLGAQQTLQITARAGSLSIAAILAGLNHTDLPIAGDLALAAEIGGTLDAPQAGITLSGTGLEAYGEPLGTLDAKAQLHGQQLEVSDLRLNKPQPDGDGSLRASGAYNLTSKAYRIEAHAKDVRLSNLTLPWAKSSTCPPDPAGRGPASPCDQSTTVRGGVSLDASGQGVTDNPVGDLKLALDRIQVGGQEFGSIEVSANAANQRVDLQASAPKFHVTATATVGIAAPNPATVQVRMAKTGLAQLPVKLEQPLEGTVSAVIDAAGELQHYEKGTARAEVSSLDLQWNGEPVRTEGPLVASYASGTLTIGKATILAADSRLEASGSLPLEASAGEGAIQLKAAVNLAGLERFLPADKKLGLQGTASAEGSIRGTLQRLDPALAIAVDGGACLSLPGSSPSAPIPPPANPGQANAGPSARACPASSQTTVNLRGQVRDGALEIESASAKMGDATLQASGVIPFALLPAGLPVELPRRQGPARMTADLKGVNLAAIEGVPKTVSGMVSAHLEAEAAQPELSAVKATLTFPELRASFDTYSVAQKGASEISIENGVARVGHFQLTGPATELALSGTAELAGRQALDLHLDGTLDASLAASFSTGVRARGATEIHAAVTGNADQPQAKGYVQVADGQFSFDQPRIGIEGLNLRVDLEGARATLSKLEGQINGGTLSGKGSLAYAGGKLTDTDLSIQADDLYLDFPAGLKTVSDLRLQLKSLEDRLALDGSVRVKEGGFTDDLYFDKGILSAVTAPRSLDLAQQRNAMLDSLRLNITVATDDPIVIQNNLAKAELSMQLVVLGSPYDMGLTGRLTIEEDSQLTLQERQYTVSRGVITFTSDRSIEPTLDIEATTTVSNYDITLQISGPPSDTKTQLTADPAGLSEPDIMALLITGKTLDEIRGQEFQVAQTQMLSYLTGRLGASLGHELEKATGLSRVRVEPNLISGEANPGARLTVGQDLTRQLSLVYSMDLVNSSDQIYIAEYDLTKRFVTRGVRQSDGSYRFDFRHDVRFGGTPRAQRAKREVRRVGLLTIAGERYFTEEQIQGKLKVKPGARYDFFKLRRGMDRVTSMYTKAGLLESSVRLKREEKGSLVNLNLKIDPGVKVEFAFEGAPVPGHVEKELRRVWYSGVFDTQRVEDAIAVLRAWLVSEKHLTPQINPQTTAPAADRKRVLFDIQMGPKFENVEWVFEGAGGLSGKQLRDVVESQKLSTEVYTKPSRVTELLTQFYYEMGFLDAAVSEPAYALTPETRTGKVIFPVKEGPHYRVGEAKFTGNTTLTPAELEEAAPLPPGDGYRPELRENALQRLREAYWAHGYNEVRTEAEIERIPERALVNLSFHVTEGTRGIVQDVIVEGNRDTSEKLIRSQLEIKPGDPVNLVKIGSSRRKLYNTGAFAVVDISREDQAPQAGSTVPDNTKLVRLRVRVQEVQPFELRYGAYYDTERGPGGIFDFSNRNSLGSARLLELIGRYDSQLHELRLSFSQPLMGRFPVKLIASPYVRREINPETSQTSGFNVDRIGFTVQQEIRLGHKILLNYGYKIEKSRTYDTGPDPIFNVPLRLASLTSTFARDTRDDILDATKGSFFSHAFEFSPETLGSQVRFAKYFGQYFRYFPLQKPRVQLFTNKVIRPRLVYATALRVGLAGGFGGQEVPLSERFFAGGGTTIRGFTQNSVGPATFTGLELGGVGMVVLNNEVRFPLVSILDGVGFVDLGNVYAHVSDFNPTDLRKAAGFGLRVRTPFLLLRVDYGFNLQRRMGEPASRLFFSIGQAF
jgi:outer membrane protein assembly complex protein YaeT